MNETIFVLGLGETLKFFKEFEKPTIGVNDIWQYVKTQTVVCVDYPNKFNPTRLAAIKESNPAKFYSQIDTWKKHLGESFEKISIHEPRKAFHENKIYHSVTSPFVACSLAYTLGYKNIVLYGVDINTHPKLKSLIATIYKDFIWLNNNFKERGVKMYVGHKASKLFGVLPHWKAAVEV
jgi:hypothetical protein